VNEERALEVIETEVIPTKTQAPAEVIRAATEQANVLADLIKSRGLFSRISGKDYVRVEGWVPLARFNNAIPREISNEAREDGSYVARVQLVNIQTGVVLTEASAECGGPDEPLWQGRAPYARRSMAATRATGKCCRLAYSWIMVLSGYEPTPAEEIPAEEHEKPKAEPKSKEEAIKHEPDTFRKIKGKNGPLIAVTPGQKLPAGYLKDLGGWEYQGSWFLKDADGNFEKLTEAAHAAL
jgi:hypothetical protein